MACLNSSFIANFAAEMDEEELIGRLSQVITKNYLADLMALGEMGELPMATLHHLCYKKGRHPVAFRAAWVLEYIASRYPERFMEIFSDFVVRLPQQQNPSCQRHFTKILMEITGPKAPLPYATAYEKIDKEQLIEVIFAWLIDQRTPVAVQANCLDVLYHMSGEFPWITEELRQQVTFLLRDGSAAIQSRGKKIAAKLAESKL